MRSALLLANDFRPLRVIPVTRAVVLVLMEKAEVIAEGEDTFRSASLEFPVPSVIRLVYSVKIPMRTRLPVTRRNVLARDKGKCAYCHGVATTVDHVKPRSRGGRHAWENVVAACLPCNGKKDDKTLEELGWKLDRSLLYAPERALWIGIATVTPEWEPYLQAARA